MKLRINKINFLIILLWTLIYPTYLPNPRLYYIYQFIVAFLILIKCFLEIKNVPWYGSLFIYPFFICISCLLNKNQILITQVARGVTGAVIMIDSYVLVHYFIRKRSSKALFSLLYRICRFYTFANIIWILILLVIGRLNEAVENDWLFSGGKFPTSYMFLYFLMYFCVSWNGNKLFSKKSKKTLFILLSILMVVLCSLIDCSTGMVGALTIMVLMLLPKKASEWISNPLAIILLIISSSLVIFILASILNIPFVQNFIENFLHNDIGLTGRMMLYRYLPRLIKIAGLFGSGFGSFVTTQLFNGSIYDAQNGLIEIILDYGYLGAIGFLLLAFSSAFNKKIFIQPLNVTIFSFIVIAVVEIPFGTGFIFLLSLLMNADSKELEINSQLPTFVMLTLKKND